MRLHLVDGTYELFRAYFSPRPGNATVKLAASLLALCEDAEEAVSHIAVAFDNPIRSFRNDLFHGYKSGEGVPEDLLEQFDPAEEATTALGIAVWSMDRWEADDALASGAARFAGDVDQVRIMTPDKDLGQSVRGQRVVQVDRMRGKLVDEERLRELRGIGPQSIPDWLGLVGDSADGIPGIEGWGAKSSATVLAHYEHIERIPDDADDWQVAVRGARRLADNLAARRDDALLYKRLATLDEDVPLEHELEDLAWNGVPREKFEKWATALGASRLRPRRWL